MKEALTLALEALKKVYDNVSFYGEVSEAIAAIEAVLNSPNGEAQPQRKPLTDEEIGKIVDTHTTDDGGYDICCSGHGVARAIEAAHGIKE